MTARPARVRPIANILSSHRLPRKGQPLRTFLSYVLFCMRSSNPLKSFFPDSAAAQRHYNRSQQRPDPRPDKPQCGPVALDPQAEGLAGPGPVGRGAGRDGAGGHERRSRRAPVRAHRQRPGRAVEGQLVSTSAEIVNRECKSGAADTRRGNRRFTCPGTALTTARRTGLSPNR